MTKRNFKAQININQPLTKEHIKQIANVPLVYALRNDDKGVFYVGQTKNLQKRAASYFNPNQCHNAELAEYLRSNAFEVVVLGFNLKDINKAEQFYIKQHAGRLFNRISIPYAKWLEKPKQPWSAGSGIRCPSDYLMWSTAKSAEVKKTDAFADVIDVMSKMIIVERAAFEVNIYRSQPDEVKEKLNKWFDLCKDNILEVLLNGADN